MSWYFLAIISVFFYSLSTIVQKKLMGDEDSNPVSFMIIFQLLVAAMILIYILIFKVPFPNIMPVWPNLLLNGVLISVGSVFMFKAIKITEAGEYTILSTSATFINLFIASVFLHEIITVNKIFGTLLIVTSILIITATDFGRKTKLHKGHIFSLASALGFGIAFSNESYIVSQIGVIQNLVIGFFLPGLFVSLLYPKSFKEIPKMISMASIRNMLASSILYLLGAITIFTAYTKGGDVGKIYGISNSTTIVTVILAAILLKERNNPARKIIATIAAFLGVLMLR
jgi:drug/metabolite transporter (DMT)-like permease